MASRNEVRAVRNWLDSTFMTAKANLAQFTVRDLLNIRVTAGEDAGRAHFSHSSIDMAFDFLFRRYERADILHIGTTAATMLIKTVAVGADDTLHAKPLFTSLLRDLQRVSYDYIMIPFADTMLEDAEENFVARPYSETQPCHWSLLVIDLRKKQISLINGQTATHHQQDGGEISQVLDRNVRDAAYWLCKAMAQVVDELSSYPKLTLFVPHENENNSFNEKRDSPNWRRDLDASSGPFIYAMLECLLKSDKDEDYTQHFLRQSLHRYLSNSFGRPIWTITLAFNSRNTRRRIAARFKRQLNGTDSPLRLGVALLRILGNDALVNSPGNVEDIYNGWLKLGNNKDLLDVSVDGGSDGGSSDDGESWRSESEDENDAGGPPSSLGSDRTIRGTSDHGGDNGDDGDDEKGTEEEEDGDDSDQGNSEEGGNNSPSSDESDSNSGGQDDSDESSSEYGVGSDSSSSDDETPSTVQRGRRESAPSPSPSLQKPPAEILPDDLEGRQQEIPSKKPSCGSTSASVSSRGRRSESEESHITPPQRSVYNSDGENEEDIETAPTLTRYKLRTRERIHYYLGTLEEPEEEDPQVILDDSSATRSESTESWITAPEEVLDDPEQDPSELPDTKPDVVWEGPASGADDGEDNNYIDEAVPTENGNDELLGDVRDPAAAPEDLVGPENEHWFTRIGNEIRDRWGLYDMRNFGTDGLDAEGRLSASGLLRKMECISDMEGPRKKRRLC